MTTRTQRIVSITAATAALTAVLFTASTGIAHSQQASKKKPTASQKQPSNGGKLTWRKVGKDFHTGLSSAGKQIGHDSGKVGRAVEYGARKGGEDVSVTAHRVAGKNSVVRDRGKQQEYLVRPDGTRVPVQSKAEADKQSGKKPKPGDKAKKP